MWYLGPGLESTPYTAGRVNKLLLTWNDPKTGHEYKVRHDNRITRLCLPLVDFIHHYITGCVPLQVYEEIEIILKRWTHFFFFFSHNYGCIISCKAVILLLVYSLWWFRFLVLTKSISKHLPEIINFLHGLTMWWRTHCCQSSCHGKNRQGWLAWWSHGQQIQWWGEARSAQVLALERGVWGI